MRKLITRILWVVAIVDAINTIIQWFTKASSLGLSPDTWLGLGVAIFFLVVIIVLGMVVFGKTKAREDGTRRLIAEVDTAILRLQLYGDERTPTEVFINNIWRWYYLRNKFTIITKERGATQYVAVNAILFLSFDRPVRVGTLEVHSPDFKLPTYEIKEFNNRFAIITFSDALPMGTLELTVRNRTS